MKQGVDKKLIVKKSLIYFAAIWIGLILPAILGVEASDLWLRALVFIFFDIAVSMKSKTARKRYTIYLLIFFGTLLFNILFSEIFDTERLEPWFSLVSGNVGMCILAGIMIHLAMSIRKTHPKASIVLKIIFGFFMLMLLLVNIATIIGMFTGEVV